MSIADLVAQVRSGVIHVEYHLSGQRVASGTGFMARNHLITNHHVFLGPPVATVVLAWQTTQDPASRAEIQIPYATFASGLVTGSDQSNFDFAVLSVPALLHGSHFQFTLTPPTSKRIGDQVLLLGFPLEHRNLVCHLGYISSFYASGPVNVIQLDASVNHSNSGGPLIDPATGAVVGIVTRKGTGLSKAFDTLYGVFDSNIAALKAATGIIGLGNVDPIAALLAGQHQMKALSGEIQRSANVGIGYAFSVEHLLSDLVFAELPIS